MLLVIHICVALAGLACSTAAFMAPSKHKINATYGLIALTLTSGTALVITTHSSILHSCVAGLVYVGVASSGALLAQRKLARQESFMPAARDKRL
jgi:hypothetical protein